MNKFGNRSLSLFRLSKCVGVMDRSRFLLGRQTTRERRSRATDCERHWLMATLRPSVTQWRILFRLTSGDRVPSSAKAFPAENKTMRARGDSDVIPSTVVVAAMPEVYYVAAL